MQFFQNILVWLAITWLYAFTFAYQIQFFRKVFETTTNQQRTLQWAIFLALFGLTLYAYLVRMLLFR